MLITETVRWKAEKWVKLRTLLRLLCCRFRCYFWLQQGMNISSVGDFVILCKKIILIKMFPSLFIPKQKHYLNSKNSSEVNLYAAVPCISSRVYKRVLLIKVLCMMQLFYLYIKYEKEVFWNAKSLKIARS